MIRVQCDCGKTVQVPDSAAGKKGKCRACGGVIRVPTSVLEPEPEADLYNDDPYAADPYADDPNGADPYAADPYASDPNSAGTQQFGGAGMPSRTKGRSASGGRRSSNTPPKAGAQPSNKKLIVTLALSGAALLFTAIGVVILIVFNNSDDQDQIVAMNDSGAPAALAGSTSPAIPAATEPTASPTDSASASHGANSVSSPIAVPPAMTTADNLKSGDLKGSPTAGPGSAPESGSSSVPEPATATDPSRFWVVLSQFEPDGYIGASPLCKLRFRVVNGSADDSKEYVCLINSGAASVDPPYEVSCRFPNNEGSIGFNLPPDMLGPLTAYMAVKSESGEPQRISGNIKLGGEPSGDRPTDK